VTVPGVHRATKSFAGRAPEAKASRQRRKRGRTLWLGLLVATAPAACAPAPAAMPNVEDVGPTVLAANRAADACRAVIAAKPRYALLAAHMPLDDIDRSTLLQMTDQQLITDAERAALFAWNQELRTCSDAALATAMRSLPVFAPIIMEARAENDAILALLAERKLTWGAAVVRLRTNRARALGKVADRATEMIVQSTRAEQTELARRTSVLNALIGTLP
jgi:hypothetical protein